MENEAVKKNWDVNKGKNIRERREGKMNSRKDWCINDKKMREGNNLSERKKKWIICLGKKVWGKVTVSFLAH